MRERWGYRGSHWCSNTPEWTDHRVEYAADGTIETYRRATEDKGGIPEQRCRCNGPYNVPKGPTEEHRAEMARYWKAWRSPLFMPRWASRITLEISDVRVQRLQGISEEDAVAEGAGAHPGTFPLVDRRAILEVHAFADQWDGLNASKAPWNSNPWVWCVSFQRVITAAAGA